MIGRNEPLHKVFLSPEIGLEINEVLASASLAYGDIGKRFEVLLSEYIGCNQILSCSTNPIYLALLALDLRPGDEVLMSPLTCLMSTQPLALLNLKPVWVDIDPTRGSIDPSDLKSKITSRTRAVILFHWCGYPGHLREIAELCDGEGLVLISDASQAFGSEFEDKQLGSDLLADVTCFNFTPVRAPTCLDGGSIAFKSSQDFERAMLCRDLGVNRKAFRTDTGEISSAHDVTVRGINAKMNEVSSFMGIKNLERFPSLLAQQRKNAKYLDEWCVQYGFKPISVGGTNPSFWAYTFITDDLTKARQICADQGVTCSQVHFPNNVYKIFGQSKTLRGVEEFMERQLTIPSGWWCRYGEHT